MKKLTIFFHSTKFIKKIIKQPSPNISLILSLRHLFKPVNIEN